MWWMRLARYPCLDPNWVCRRPRFCWRDLRTSDWGVKCSKNFWADVVEWRRIVSESLGVSLDSSNLLVAVSEANDLSAFEAWRKVAT